MSKAGLAGYIVSFPIPEVIMGINSFMLGAQSVNPDFKVKIVWVNTWFDPGKEADAAKALFDQGADIIVQHTDSTAPLQIAEERGLFGFGHDKVRAEGAAYLHRRRLGSLLYPPCPGADGRHLEADQCLGGAEGGRRPHVPLHQYAGGRRQGGRGDGAEDRLRRVPSVHRA